MQGEIMQDYYVYGHYTVNADQLFYIGKGTGYRFKSTTNRSKDWLEFTKENKWYYKIIENNLSEEEALRIESELIQKNSNTVLNKNINNKVKIIPDFSELFYYDETSPSCLYWVRDNTGVNGIVYNKKDSLVGSVDKDKNVWKIVVDGKKYYIHRIVYTLHKRLDSNLVIDHLNGDSLDNRICNLEAKTQKNNSRNCKKSSANTTGVVGVSFRIKNKDGKEYPCFTAHYQDNRKLITKTFSVIKYGKEEAFRLACQWRKEQIEQLNADGAGYTDRHGT
jgi:hypothetical protein